MKYRCFDCAKIMDENKGFMELSGVDVWAMVFLCYKCYNKRKADERREKRKKKGFFAKLADVIKNGK